MVMMNLYFSCMDFPVFTGQVTEVNFTRKAHNAQPCITLKTKQ